MSFLSGTDCYGSPIVEGYRKKLRRKLYGHNRRLCDGKSLRAKENIGCYGISLDFYGASRTIRC